MDWEAIELALALHAHPARTEIVRAQPLPSGVTALLRVAVAHPETVDAAVRVFGVSPEHLIEASRFFVEQQLLDRRFDHDAWRQLGVPAGANPDLARLHHRLLVRLVHPDRSDDWASNYANRVNQAWRIVREADASNHVPDSPRPSDIRLRVPAAKYAVPSGSPEPTVVRSWSTTVRWLGSAVAVAAFLAIMIMATTLPSEEPASVVDEQRREMPSWLPSPGPYQPEPESTTPPTAASREPSALVPLASLELSEVPEPTAPSAAVTPSPRISTTVDAEPDENTHPSTTGAGASDFGAKDPLPVVTTIAANGPTRPVERAPSARDIGIRLLGRFRDRYVAGDLSGLLALYSRKVHADTHRLALVARNYSQVFHGSQQRYIAFRDIEWETLPGGVRGRGRYEAGYRRLPSLRGYAEHGIVEVQWIEEGDEPRLARLDLRAD